MKITNEQLRRIIKEEIEAVLEQTEQDQGPMTVLDGEGNLVIINYGKDVEGKGRLGDYIELPLDTIKQELMNYGDKFLVNRFVQALTESTRTQIDFHMYKGIEAALKKKGHLGSINKELLEKNLTTKNAILSNKGKGSPNTIKMYANKKTQASFAGDSTTPGNRVVVNDPTME